MRGPLHVRSPYPVAAMVVFTVQAFILSINIAIKFHYTRQAVHQGSVDVRRVPTADNRADLLTKSVKMTIFKKLLDKLKGFDGVAKL